MPRCPLNSIRLCDAHDAHCVGASDRLLLSVRQSASARCHCVIEFCHMVSDLRTALAEWAKKRPDKVGVKEFRGVCRAFSAA